MFGAPEPVLSSDLAGRVGEPHALKGRRVMRKSANQLLEFVSRLGNFDRPQRFEELNVNGQELLDQQRRFHDFQIGLRAATLRDRPIHHVEQPDGDCQAEGERDARRPKSLEATQSTLLHVGGSSLFQQFIDEPNGGF
jgi:hypothetical protein